MPKDHDRKIGKLMCMKWFVKVLRNFSPSYYSNTTKCVFLALRLPFSVLYEVQKLFIVLFTVFRRLSSRKLEYFFSNSLPENYLFAQLRKFSYFVNTHSTTPLDFGVFFSSAGKFLWPWKMLTVLVVFFFSLLFRVQPVVRQRHISILLWGEYKLNVGSW